MTGAWPKVLAATTVLLGLGYAGSAVLVWRGLDAPEAGVFLSGLGLLILALGVGAWRNWAGARAGAIATGLLGSALYGAMAVGAERDRDASDLVNNINLTILYGLLALSALVLASGVILAVVERTEARHQRTAHLR